MLSHLKYQAYITKRSRFTYGIAFCLFLFTSVFYLLAYLTSKGQLEVQEMVVATDLFASRGILEIVLSFYYSDKIILFVGSFVVFFSLVEYKDGFIKSIYHPNFSVMHYILSKLAIIFAYIVACFLMVLVLTIFFCLLCVPHQGWGSLSQFISLTLIQILVEFSFSTLIFLVCLYSKKIIWCLLGTLLYIMFAPITIYGSINFIVRKLGWTAFQIERFLPYGNTYQLSMFDSKEHFLMAIVSGLVFIVLGILLSKRTLERRDIL